MNLYFNYLRGIILNILPLLLFFNQLFTQTVTNECDSTHNSTKVTLSSSSDDLFKEISMICDVVYPTLYISMTKNLNITLKFDSLVYLSPLEYFSLSNCNLSNIFWIPSFKNNISISYLKIYGCNSISLPSFAAFIGFDSLRTIDFSNNSLETLPLDWFYFSPVLSDIKLSNNRFIHLPLIPKKITANIELTNNSIDCSDCRNAFNYKPRQHKGFFCEFPPACPEYVKPTIDGKTAVSKFTASDLMFSCYVTNSSSPKSEMQFSWISPMGLIPDSRWFSFQESNQIVYDVSIRPIIYSSSFDIISQSNRSVLSINSLRGAFSGSWFCLVKTNSGIYISELPVGLHVKSTFTIVFNVSILVGFTVMFALLLIGIVGGAIRYLIETNCCSKRQPHYRYGGKKFVGVIPVPLYDDNTTINETLNDETSPSREPNSPTFVDDHSLAYHNGTRINADVKLLLINSKLVEEYCQELDQLQKARLHPSYDFFYERLEAFRTRLKADAGHNLKVLLYNPTSSIEESQPLLNLDSDPQQERSATDIMMDRMRSSLSHMKDQLNNFTDLCSNAISLPMHSRLLFGQRILIYQTRSTITVNHEDLLISKNSDREIPPINREVKIAEYIF